jgi:hypothetical protein
VTRREKLTPDLKFFSCREQLRHFFRRDSRVNRKSPDLSVDSFDLTAYRENGTHAPCAN